MRIEERGGGLGGDFLAEKRPEMITAHCLIVGFLAGLGGKGKGNSVAVRFSQDDFDLVDNIDGINKFGNVEAFLFDNVFADNLGEDDVFGDAGLDGFGVGQLDGDVKGSIDKGDFVSLGLVFLTAVLVFSCSVVISITGGFAAGDLHGLRFILISHLGDSCGEDIQFGSIAVCAEFVLVDGLSDNTVGSDLVITVIVILYFLNSQGDGGGLGGESGHADLSVDRGVGIPAVDLGTVCWGMVSVCWGMVGKSHGGKRKSQDKGLDEKMRKL